MQYILLTTLLTVLIAAARVAQPADNSLEPIDRGVVAMASADGKVYVGWRLLQSDPGDVVFNVYRRAADGQPVKLNDEPIRKTTDFVDASATAGIKYAWSVRPVVDANEGPASAEASAQAGDQRPYLPLPLLGQYTFQKVGIADLDGDGRYDFVIKQPGDNIDPYEKYWKPSPDTYKLEAYRHDGQPLWQYDLGWAIERGIWYSPYVVYDLNGDGYAEVAMKTGVGDPRDPDGRVHTGPEYLSVRDGRTGRMATIDWPSRDGFGPSGNDYNRSCRNQLAVAYLDGQTPALIVERGTYDRMKMVAYRYDGQGLTQLWNWDNRGLGREWQGQGAHWTQAADIDGDGRDEIVLGSAVVDDGGKPLWTTGLGHPDHCYIGDIDPARKGLEIYFGLETRQRERNGMCLVAAATGKILWGHEGYTRHVHGQGMCSDIDPRYPGGECYGADTDTEKKYAWSRLRTAQGVMISEENLGGFSPTTVYWDADLQRELLREGRISDYGGQALPIRIEGKMVAVADVLGDWREEIITSVAGELRIYSTTMPAADRRVCLMQDRLYRMNVVAAAMGYFQVPMTSYDLSSQME